MHPILFEIPGLGFPIRSFGVMVALGFLLSSHILGRLAVHYDPLAQGGERAAADVAARYARVTVWVIIGVLLGARAMYVIVEMARGTWHAETPLDYLAIWKGGIAMYGGLFGGIAAGLLGARKNGIAPIQSLDLGLTAGFFGLAVGRIGCFLVGDDHGSIVPPRYEHLPFPITLRVPPASELSPHSLFGIENAGKVLWATQVWMFANALVIGLVGLWLLRRRRYAGEVSLWLVLLYAIGRGAIERFRGDEVRGVWFGGALSTSQLIAIVSGSIAAFLLIRFRGKRDPAIALRAAGGR